MCDYVAKVKDQIYVQINRSYFLLLDHEPIQEQFENWNSLEKRANNYSIYKKWQSYLKSINKSRPNKMHGLTKHVVDTSL